MCVCVLKGRFVMFVDEFRTARRNEKFKTNKIIIPTTHRHPESPGDEARGARGHRRTRTRVRRQKIDG